MKQTVTSTSLYYIFLSSVCITQVDLEVTLPGEGKDRVFNITMKWAQQISLFGLEEALQGKVREIPVDAIMAVDIIMRHLPSMT